MPSTWMPGILKEAPRCEKSVSAEERETDVPMASIGGDHLVALDQRHLHPGNDGFLADVKVAEAADEAHAVKLAGLLLEAADEQHMPVGGKLFFLGEFGRLRCGNAWQFVGF